MMSSDIFGDLSALSDREVVARVFGHGHPAFPWDYRGFQLRSERREFRLSQVPWFNGDGSDDDEEIEYACRMNDIARKEHERVVLRNRKIVDADECYEYAHLSHDEFLDTAYWLGLAEWMKLQEGKRCSDCQVRFVETKDLDVHHKTYAHRGREYPDHLSDLVVLCRRCHSRRHGK